MQIRGNSTRPAANVDTPQTSFSPTPPVPPAASPSRANLSQPLIAGVAVLFIAGALLWWYSGGFSASGSLIFFSHEPVVGLYTYSFGSKETTPLDVPSLEERLNTQSTSFSPYGNFYVQHLTKADTNTPLLVVGNVKSGVTHYLGSSDAGARFDFPIVSNDGKYVAYNQFSFITSAKTESDITNGKGESTPLSLLAYASLDGEVFTPHPLAVTGTPLLFSPDQTKLLVRQLNELSVVSLADSASTVVTLPFLNNSAPGLVALSKDTRALAVTTPGAIYWGRLDWSTGQFSIEGTLAQQARALSFGAGDELLFLNEEGFHSHNLNTGKTRTMNAPKEFTAELNTPFTFVP